MSEVQNYVPIISDRLTTLLETSPGIQENATAELIASAEGHAKTNDGLSVTPVGTEEFQRLDCVGVHSALPHADADSIAAQVSAVSPIADQIIDSYLKSPDTLQNFYEIFSSGKKVSLIYDHRGLLEVAFGAACFLRALYDKGHFNPGDIDLEMVVGAITKFVSMSVDGLPETPVVSALVNSGVYQTIRFVVPNSYSTKQTEALQELQPKFNTASGKAKITDKNSGNDNKTVEVICPSASTDKKLLTPDNFGTAFLAYHMAPVNEGPFKRSHTQLLGIGKDPNKKAAVFIGDLLPPTNDPREINRRMRSIAEGMSLVSAIPSILHENPEEYAQTIETLTRAA